jgi:hypothetical protein
VVTLLAHSPILPWLTGWLAPYMGLFGLPGSAALPLLLAATVSLHSGLAAATGIGLRPGEMTTLALMVGLCHNLIVEGGLLARMRQPALVWTLVRVATAVAMGMVVGPWLAGR